MAGKQKRRCAGREDSWGRVVGTGLTGVRGAGERGREKELLAKNTRGDGESGGTKEEGGGERVWVERLRRRGQRHLRTKVRGKFCR